MSSRREFFTLLGGVVALLLQRTRRNPSGCGASARSSAWRRMTPKGGRGSRPSRKD